MIFFDSNIVIEQLLPINRRRFRNIAFLKFLSKPIRTLITDFTNFYVKKRYDLAFNGQVVYLEHVLNDFFDEVDRGIYISDSPEAAESNYLFNEVEGNEETYLFNVSELQSPLYLYNQQELTFWPDFIVNVPAAVSFNNNQMTALINRYKLAGKNYIINIV